MGDPVKNASTSLGYNWGISRPGMNTGDTYLNPDKVLSDIKGIGSSKTQDSRVNDMQEVASGAADQAGQANQAQVAQGRANDASMLKFSNDQKRAGDLAQGDLNSAMMDAQAKANMAKRGRSKMYSSRLNVGEGGL